MSAPGDPPVPHQGDEFVYMGAHVGMAEDWMEQVADVIRPIGHGWLVEWGQAGTCGRVPEVLRQAFGFGEFFAPQMHRSLIVWDGRRWVHESEAEDGA